MKFFNIFFTDTNFWEEELSVEIFADNEDEAVLFLTIWIEEKGKDFFAGINTNNIKVYGGKKNNKRCQGQYLGKIVYANCLLTNQKSCAILFI